METLTRPQESLIVPRGMAGEWWKLNSRKDEVLGEMSFVGAVQKYTWEKRQKTVAGAGSIFTV